jgi:hypothetical protein
MLGVEAPGIAYSNLNASLLFAEAVGAINIPVAAEPVMVRSFVNHHGKKKTHVLSVGDPGEINYSYDLASGSLLQCWRGDFVETTLMWHGRGEPQLAEPLGSVIEFSGRPSVSILRDKNADWPDSNTTYNYRGYDISSTGNPIIKYSLGNTLIKESLTGEAAGHKLSHTITVESAESADVWCIVAEGSVITKMPNGLYAVNDKEYYIQLPDKTEPLIRKNKTNATTLLLPVKTKDKNTLNYFIIW